MAIIDILKCPDCEAMAISINDTRITGPNCKLWDIMETFQVQSSVVINALQLNQEIIKAAMADTPKSILCNCPEDEREPNPHPYSNICVACSKPFRG